LTIDKSGANLAALEAINDDREAPIRIRQSIWRVALFFLLKPMV
jgi:amino acid permease